ncbi:helix-turn-helix domain-containing protein [Synechococcus elongatus IITB4]|uniref:helix-turn-helix domain-containing protein n=1 Tax=Synechococcus elongatus TaxID=32046 RepID=UPI0030CB0F0C
MPNPDFRYNYETRIETVLEVLKGKTKTEVSKETGIARQTIGHWVKAYREEAERRLNTPIIDIESGDQSVPPESDRPNRMQRLLNNNLNRREQIKRLKDCWRVDPFQEERH